MKNTTIDYENLQKLLEKEKNIIYYVVADSMAEAFEKYRELQVKSSASIHSSSIH